MSFLICPSILSADFCKLGQEVTDVLNAGADRIHFDVMDNHYVPNLSFGPVVCESLRQAGIKAPIDVHLMVEPVDGLVEPFAKAGASLICFHPEASKHVDRTIQLIKSFNIEVGVVLNPATPLSCLDHILPALDRILVMSVNPGFGGQSFIPSTLDKLKAIRALIQTNYPNIRIEVDGGVTPSNIAEIAQAGADTFVAGSSIFKAKDYQAVIKSMHKALSTIR